MESELTISEIKDIISEFTPQSISVAEHTTKTQVIKVKISGNRKEFLLAVYEKLKNLGFISNITQRSKLSKSSGHIKIGNIYICAKPITGATEDLSITASTLIQHGDIVNMDIFGCTDTVCSVFSSADQLIQSIMLSLENNSKVSPYIIKVFNDYFKHINETPPELQWNSNIKNSEKNELGKYLGELLLGILVASNGIGSVCSDSNFLNDVVNTKRLIYPVSSNFQNIDSIIDADTLIAISSKLGTGSAASFFSNILPYLENVSSPVLTNIIKFQKHATGLTKTEQQFSIIYEYGLRITLNGLFDFHIDDEPIQVFRDLKTLNFSDLIMRVSDAILKFTANDTSKSTKKMLEYLCANKNYSAITGFFAREIVKDLNLDIESMLIMEQVISTKDFYQANLKYDEWVKGIIKFSVKKGDTLKLVMMGNKSGYSDLSCSAGKINYELRTI
jgi:hypothetical protein